MTAAIASIASRTTVLHLRETVDRDAPYIESARHCRREIIRQLGQAAEAGIGIDCILEDGVVTAMELKAHVISDAALQQLLADAYAAGQRAAS